MTTSPLRVFAPSAPNIRLLYVAAQNTGPSVSIHVTSRGSRPFHRRWYAAHPSAAVDSRINPPPAQDPIPQTRNRPPGQLYAAPMPQRPSSRGAKASGNAEGVGTRGYPAAIPDHPRPPSAGPSRDLISTRPAPLDLPRGPEREEDGAVTVKSRVLYFYKIGRTYMKFYKDGLKNIWYNQKEYRDVRKKYTGTSNILSALQRGSYPNLTRREFQLFLRTKHDLKRLIPFGLIFFICGEFTPIALLAFGTLVVPYTCRLPQQAKKDLSKTAEHIKIVERGGKENAPKNTNHALAYIHGLDPFAIAFTGIPVLAHLLRRIWIEPKYRQRMENIICDAMLVKYEGGVGNLEVEELLQFCIAVRKVDTIKYIHDCYARGATPPIADPAEIKRNQKEVQLFIDNVDAEMKARGSVNAESYQAESIFVAAAQRTAAVVNAPFLPLKDSINAGEDENRARDGK